MLDHESGLVWEKSPATLPLRNNWVGAIYQCNTKEVGGRRGWHLPTIQQLASHLATSEVSPAYPLPAGHPFTGVQPDGYWSVTTNASVTTNVWLVTFSDDSTTNGAEADD